MTRELQLSRIRDGLRRRRDQLRRHMAGEMAMLGTDEDFESLDDEEYAVMAQFESKELASVVAAIERMENGTYGVCEECEAEIPLVRLKALPCSSRCIECQQAGEGDATVRKAPGKPKRSAMVSKD